MREMTAEEKRAYNHIILGARQMSIVELLGDHSDTRDTLPPFPDETDKRIVFTQMKLFE